MSFVRVIKMFEENKSMTSVGIDGDPYVFSFGKEFYTDFEDIQALLKEKGFQLIDVNQSLTVKPEDYNMPLSAVGNIDPENQYTINDLLVPDEVKRHLIVRGKCREIIKEIDNNTVLVVKYNDQILNDKTIYASIRSWLKDGVSLDGVEKLRAIKAIVYLETNERLSDFCRYRIPFDWR